MNPDYWTGLVDSALSPVEGLSAPQAAERVGVSANTIRRWRELREAGEEIPEPRGEPREALLRGAIGADGRGNDLDDEAEIERIKALPDPLLRVLEQESYAAVLRAQGVRDACRAALIEAEKAIDRSGLISSDGRLTRRAVRASRAAHAAAREHAKQLADPSAGKEPLVPEKQDGQD